MKIDAGTNYLNLDPSGVVVRTNHGNSAVTSVGQPLPTAAQSSATGSRQVDFSSMTRQELIDWTNQKIRDGELTLDDSHIFVSMTLKMPVGAKVSLPVEGDMERFDFTRKVRDGIEGALQRQDDAGVRMLEIALGIMQRHQGQTTGIDIRA